MQRQSLGSPASKHHHPLLSNITSPSSPQHEEEDELRNQKKPPYSRPDQRFIHLIPLLAILCFLILYLSSHHPSHIEMAQFSKKLQDSIDEIEPLLEINKGGILAIRSLRNLQEIDEEENYYQQLHRKIGDF